MNQVMTANFTSELAAQTRAREEHQRQLLEAWEILCVAKATAGTHQFLTAEELQNALGVLLKENGRNWAVRHYQAEDKATQAIQFGLETPVFAVWPEAELGGTIIIWYRPALVGDTSLGR